MTERIYCGRCREEVDHETFNFWQGTAWCTKCETVVIGSMCKVPCWAIATVVLLVIHISLF